jgi:hypothetical protein
VFGDTFWIDQVLPTPAPGKPEVDLHNLDYRFGGADVAVITDVRYPNEAERVQALGGCVIEVTRPGLNSDGHASETPLPRELVDLVIENDGTLEDYANKLDSALQVWGI